MTLARVRSVALAGVVGNVVDVEVHLAAGLPGLTLVGLPDAALSEARDRVRAAVLNSGEKWPQQRITVNLSPASLHKHGSGFDLALACGVLAADGRLPSGRITDLVILGELGLDGGIRGVRGVLPAVLAAVQAGFPRVVVPAANAAEASAVPGAIVCPVTSLTETLLVLRGEIPSPPAPSPPAVREAREQADLSEVLGQAVGRHAVEVAAAGGHHLFLHGPPGVGKTMLAERMPGVLPELGDEEALEVASIHSVAGLLAPGHGLPRRRPFQAPHHSATMPALIGGGAGIPRPGAASLAHCGVLLLDEAPEFQRNVLDALRQPLESGSIVISRAQASVTLPARFQLVLTANPCPCGLGSGKGLRCTCSATQKRKYFGKLSGPLLDRVDLQVEVHAPTRAEMVADASTADSSDTVIERVGAARERAIRRLAPYPFSTNAQVPGSLLRQELAPARAGADLVDLALSRGALTPRGADRVLRVAWTLADLAGADRPDAPHVRGGLSLRLGPAGLAA